MYSQIKFVLVPYFGHFPIRDNQYAAKDVDLRIKVGTECIDLHRGHRDGCVHQKIEYKRRKRESQR